MDQLKIELQSNQIVLLKIFKICINDIFEFYKIYREDKYNLFDNNREWNWILF